MSESSTPRGDQKDQGTLLGARPPLRRHSGDRERALSGHCLGLHSQWLVPPGRFLSDTSVPSLGRGPPTPVVLRPPLCALCWGPALGRSLGPEGASLALTVGPEAASPPPSMSRSPPAADSTRWLQKALISEGRGEGRPGRGREVPLHDLSPIVPPWPGACTSGRVRLLIPRPGAPPPPAPSLSLGCPPRAGGGCAPRYREDGLRSWGQGDPRPGWLAGEGHAGARWGFVPLCVSLRPQVRLSRSWGVTGPPRGTPRSRVTGGGAH